MYDPNPHENESRHALLSAYFLNSFIPQANQPEAIYSVLPFFPADLVIPCYLSTLRILNELFLNW